MASAVLFDAYGTLFDVYSVSALAEQLFPQMGAQLTQLWRDKQLEYTRLRTLSNQYADFEQVTVDALAYAADLLKLTPDAEQSAQLLDQYRRLTAFREVKVVLDGLKTLGYNLGILSNGTPAMLESAIEAAKLKNLFKWVISVDAVKKFKTAPEAYQLGLDVTRGRLNNIIFVSANHWDICGAAWFGYKTFWVNRAALPPERLGVTPTRTGKSLSDLAMWLEE